MCLGIALPYHDLPATLSAAHELQGRLYPPRCEGADREFRFLWRDPAPVLPVWHGGRLHLCPWGNRQSNCPLPRGGWAGTEDVEAGRWAELVPELVLIEARLGYAGGIWFQVVEGIRGVLVRDAEGQPRVYLLTEPATHYYQTMTRQARMPVLVNQVL